MIGMNSHILHQLFLQFWTTLQHAVDVVKRSKIRRWFQQKSRRSAALRAAFVVVAMGLAHQVSVRAPSHRGVVPTPFIIRPFFFCNRGDGLQAVKLAKAIVAAHRKQQLMLPSS